MGRCPIYGRQYMKESSKKYNLNSKQIRLLKLIFKFRFVTSTLLAKHLKLSSHVVVNHSLKILLEQDYIGRSYKKSYRLQGKGARYYLAPKGLKYLRKEHGLNEKALHAFYKNKTVNQTFVDHCLDVFSAYIRLSSNTPDRFNIYSKYELHGLNYFPYPAPDLYLRRIVPSEDKPNDYFLDIFDSPLFYVIKKRFAQYVDHFDEGDWETKTKRGYPAMLLACPNSYMENKLQVYTKDSLDDAGIDELDIYTTTVKALYKITNQKAEIWHKVVISD